MIFISIAAFMTMLFGCGSSKLLFDVTATPENQTYDDTYNKVKAAIVNNGFDVKEEDKDAGFITTTYKKWSYTSGGIVTLRLQIRANVHKLAGGKAQVVLTPGVKEAVKEVAKKSVLETVVEVAKVLLTKTTEEEDLGEDRQLVYYDEKDRDIGFLTSEDKKIKIAMLKTFLKLADDVGNACGLTKDQLKLNISQ
jgi:hypothetical protein